MLRKIMLLILLFNFTFLRAELECFRNHTKGGFIGGFLFRINVNEHHPEKVDRFE